MGTIFQTLVTCVAFFLAALPPQLFKCSGDLLGKVLYLLGFRLKVVRENLILAYPEMPEAEKINLIKKNYSHYGILFLEFLRYFYRFDRFLENRCTVEGEENLRNALAKGRGVFVLTSHVGNWEYFAAFGAHVLQVPVTIVTKQIKPKWLQDFSERTRAALKVKMAFEPKTLKEVLKALRNQEIVGFVMDQYTGAPVGARVPFFGIPVGSHTALATLALRYKAPVVPGFSHRKSDGSYVIRFEPEIPLQDHEDFETALLLNTAEFVKKTEVWVREFPEQWLWIHKRWKGDLSPLKSNTIGELLK